MYSWCSAAPASCTKALKLRVPCVLRQGYGVVRYCILLKVARPSNELRPDESSACRGTTPTARCRTIEVEQTTVLPGSGEETGQRFVDHTKWTIVHGGVMIIPKTLSGVSDYARSSDIGSKGTRLTSRCSAILLVKHARDCLASFNLPFGGKHGGRS